MANIKELKETIEKAIIEFSKENEVDNMNVHVTIQKKRGRNRNKHKII